MGGISRQSNAIENRFFLLAEGGAAVVEVVVEVVGAAGAVMI